MLSFRNDCYLLFPLLLFEFLHFTTIFILFGDDVLKDCFFVEQEAFLPTRDMWKSEKCEGMTILYEVMGLIT